MATTCDHKFIDSKSCLKCGWTPPDTSPVLRALFGCCVCPFSAVSSVGWFEIEIVTDRRVLRFCPQHALAAEVLSGIGLSGDDTKKRITATLDGAL
jgi:hypothetical protein